MNAERKKCETLIYRVFDAIDPSQQNSNYYKEKFALMDDSEFKRFIAKDFPFVFQYKPFVIEPTFTDMKKAADILDIQLVEEVNLPHVHRNSNGVPVKSKPALVIYADVKKLKQFITKKNAMSTDINDRDMRTGLLLSHDKNSKESDREMESLVVMGHSATMQEMSRYRADSMAAKNAMHNTINLEGQVYQKDIPVDIDDSLSKNLVDVYLIGSLIDTNMVTDDHYAKDDKRRRVTRETE